MTPHDSPAIRTRWAWMRTALAVAAVGALTARGLLVHGAGPLAIGIAVLASLTLIALGLVRARQLTLAEATELTAASGASPTTLLTALAVIVILSAVAIAGALG